MTVLLEVKNLVKTYGSFTAVDDVSFAIAEGTCFGLLGPNGAGKTTTIEVVEDIVPPTSGQIFYKGRPRTQSFRAKVGIQFQQTALLSFLTVSETLQTFSRLYPDTADLNQLIELCQLGDFKNQYNDRISGGQRQRFLLALALVNQPDLVFLDEPSTGLDPQARHNLWAVVQNIKAAGKTVVLTTHYMEEAEHLCDEIAIMDHGQIIAQGTPQRLIKANCGNMKVIVPVRNFGPAPPALNNGYQRVGGNIEISTDDLNRSLNTLIAGGVDLSDATVRSPNLEDVFLNLTGRQLRD
jgi:ABC-2 type transport system ATP-binding protein